RRDHFDLEGDAEGQLRHADAAARVLALVAEGQQEQLGGAVGDDVDVREAGGRGDEVDGLEDAHPVELAAAGVLEGGDGVEGAQPRRLLRLRNRDGAGGAAADLARDGWFAVAGGDLPGDP